MDVRWTACLIEFSSQWRMGVFVWSLVQLFGILPVTAYPDPFGVRDLSVHICTWFGEASSNSGTSDFNLDGLIFPLL